MCLHVFSLQLLIKSEDLAGAGVIKFGIESKMSSPWTSTEKFKLAIVEALHDMKIISEFTVASHL